MLFQPTHPATRFRAFETLAEAMEEHLVLLARKRYRTAWPAVLAGDVGAFARELRARGYFTASAPAYASAMRPAFEAFLRSSAYDDACRALAQDDVPTVPELEPTLAIVHPLPEWPTPRYELGDDGQLRRVDDEPDDVA